MSDIQRGVPLILFALGVITIYCGCSTTVSDPTAITGRILFQSQRNGNTDLYVMNADGSKEVRLTSDASREVYPDWSPDGSKITFVSDRDGDSEIFTMNADGSEITQLTHNTFIDNSPKWSPDGASIAFYSKRDDQKSRIYIIAPDGSNERVFSEVTADHLSPAWSLDEVWIATESALDDRRWEDPNIPRRNQIWMLSIDGSEAKQLTDMEAYNGYPTWSSAGDRIAFDSNPAGTTGGSYDIHSVTIDGLEVRNLSKSSGSDLFADWSPDGQYIAFMSNRDGNDEIYIMRADGSHQTRITVNSFSDSNPSWAP